MTGTPLAKHEEAIASTMKPLLRITAEPERDMPLWASKFGGLPFLPRNFPHPFDRKGMPLYLLAQINFAEAPPLELFPEAGILQFYLADDDVYGLNFRDPTKQESFRVLYFPQVDMTETQSDFGFLPQVQRSPLMSKQASHKLAFELTKMPMSPSDYRFEKTLGRIIGQREDLMRSFENDVFESGHRMGGYPYFTQEDPRSTGNFADKDVLLLQIDTDDENNIMWGDCGVGAFFINESDLRDRVFSRVLYNWDCC